MPDTHSRSGSGHRAAPRTVHVSPDDPVFPGSELELSVEPASASAAGTWRVKTGALHGLTLDGRTGMLTGRPTESTRLVFEKVNAAGDIVGTSGEINVVLRVKIGDSALTTPQTQWPAVPEQIISWLAGRETTG